MASMPVPPARLKTLLAGQLDFYASQRWPQHLTAHLPGGDHLPLCRLRYLGSPTNWAFALYHASTETYHDTLLPDGNPTGTPEQALDCALGLYLADPTAWINPPKD